MDPITQEALRRIVEEAVARATAGQVPFAWVAAIVVPLAGALVYDHTVIIPRLAAKKDENQDAYLNFAMSAAPILDRAASLIEKCRDGCPVGKHPIGPRGGGDGQ